MEIVRALASAPEVLFLDEPTVGLDTRIRHDLFDVISTLREHTGVTIIMTTHYLDEAEHLCDRLAVMDAGRIVACDSPAHLLASIGPDVLELRVDDTDVATQVLRAGGVPTSDVVVIGSTVTASLRATTASQALTALDEHAVAVRSATTRRASLDDVYLQLTGGHIGGSNGKDLQ